MSKNLLKNGWKGVTIINTNIYSTYLRKSTAYYPVKQITPLNKRQRTKVQSKHTTRKKLSIFMLITKASNKNCSFNQLLLPCPLCLLHSLPNNNQFNASLSTTSIYQKSPYVRLYIN